jgi:hypothetical protein
VNPVPEASDLPRLLASPFEISVRTNNLSATLFVMSETKNTMPDPDQFGLYEKDMAPIRARDKTCVYCHKEMIDESSGKLYRDHARDWATIEHLHELPPWDNPATVTMCCGSCNSSRGKKTHAVWFKSQYCKERNISAESVAEPVKEYLATII